MAMKFMRGIDFHTAALVQMDGAFLLKLIYEFWCYCINGGAGATTPGGLAATTPSTMQANFIGGTSLLASGSDGQTTLDSDVLYASSSTPFTSNMNGKHVVLWSPSSGSSEDAIYPITRVTDTSHIRLDVNKGGTPASVTLRPHLTARTGLYYRVIDLYTAAAAVTDTTSRYFVMQMTPPAGNVGQANSQVQMNCIQASGRTAGKPMDISVVLSPGGTWTGSAFTDGSSEIKGDYNATLGFFNTVGSGSNDLYNNVVLIGDKDFLLCYVAGDGFASGLGSGFHIEIPDRVHSADTNPIMAMFCNLLSLFTCGNTSQAYAGGFKNKWDDGVTRKIRTITRSYCGDSRPFGSAGSTDSTRMTHTPTGKLMIAPLYGSQLLTSGRWSFIRNKIRRVALTQPSIPSFHRLGDSGEWLHMQNGVCWPWDNTVLPYSLLIRGF